jgi:hypothetical protein
MSCVAKPILVFWGQANELAHHGAVGLNPFLGHLYAGTLPLQQTTSTVVKTVYLQKCTDRGLHLLVWFRGFKFSFFFLQGEHALKMTAQGGGWLAGWLWSAWLFGGHSDEDD